jgi:hypothetical protein
MDEDGRDPNDPDDLDDPRSARFLPILLYVLGFMVALALLAATTVWILRRVA